MLSQEAPLFTIDLRRGAFLSILAMLLGFPVVGPLSADEIFVIHDGQLERRGVEQSSVEIVGAIDIEPVTLEFTDEGELLALMRDGALYRIDIETAATELVVSARAVAGERYLEMASAPGGQLFFILQKTDLRRDLVLFDLASEEELNLGPLRRASSAPTPPGSINTLGTLAMLDDNLVGLDQEIGGPRFYGVGAVTGGLHALSSTLVPVSFAYQTDTDSDGNLWNTFFQSTVAPPARVLSAVDSETLESADRPAYLFSVGESIPFAVRRNDPATCRHDENSICLLDGRYRVTATWRDFDDNTGVGSIVPGASETTTLFSFFSPDNQELMVKVLDGCGFNERVWVFLSGTTNVEFSLRVLDSWTGEERNYDNALGEVATTILDTEAFEHCP